MCLDTCFIKCNVSAVVQKHRAHFVSFKHTVSRRTVLLGSMWVFKLQDACLTKGGWKTFHLLCPWAFKSLKFLWSKYRPAINGTNIANQWIKAKRGRCKAVKAPTPLAMCHRSSWSSLNMVLHFCPRSCQQSKCSTDFRLPSFLLIKNAVTQMLEKTSLQCFCFVLCNKRLLSPLWNILCCVFPRVR